MTQPKQTSKKAAVPATPDQVVHLYGPDNEGWYDTRVRDWVALCPDLKDGTVRGYIILRSLIIEKFHQHVRQLSMNKLCELIPGPSDGPSSLTRVRGILAELTEVGLVTTPEGEPVKTSSRPASADKPLRLRINDAAPEGYAGWRNTEDKLKAITDPESVAAAEPRKPAKKKSTPRTKQPAKPTKKTSPAKPAEAPAAPPEEERAGPASPSSSEAETGTSAEVPEQRSSAEPGVETVLAAYTDAMGVTPLSSTLEELREEAAHLLAKNWPVEHVAKLAAQMPGQGYASLLKHAKFNPPPVKTSPSSSPSGPPRCPKHTMYQEGDCPPCIKAERQRTSREGSIGTVNGQGLLQRLLANQQS